MMPLYASISVFTMAFTLFSDYISIESADIMWTGALIGLAPILLIGGTLYVDKLWLHPDQENTSQNLKNRKNFKTEIPLKLRSASLIPVDTTQAINSPSDLYTSPTRSTSLSVGSASPYTVKLQYSPPSPTFFAKTANNSPTLAPSSKLKDTKDEMANFCDSSENGLNKANGSAILVSFPLMDGADTVLDIKENGQSSSSSHSTSSASTNTPHFPPQEVPFKALVDNGNREVIDITTSASEKPSRTCCSWFTSFFDPRNWCGFFCPQSSNSSVYTTQNHSKNFPVELKETTASSSLNQNEISTPQYQIAQTQLMLAQNQFATISKM
jgi:hypothetical protein